MKIKFLVLSQALMIGQISQYSEVLFGIYGMVKDEGTHNSIQSHSTPYRYLGLILHFFTGNLEDDLLPGSGSSDGLQTHLCGIQLHHSREYFLRDLANL